jgi:hypothetical protein
MKHFFFSLKPRERMMALAAIVVAAFLWSTGAWGRVRGNWDGWQALEEEARTQKSWTSRETEIRNAAAAAVNGLDSGRGYDEAKLVAEAVAAAREAGLSPSTESPKPAQKAGKFAVHSLQMTCRKADMTSVLRFYDSVKARAPYLAIGQLSMLADRGSVGTVTLKVQVTALELLGEAPAPAKPAEPGK